MQKPQNFTNKVIGYDNMQNENSMLTPRLQEFIQQVNFRKQNGITPEELPLEKTFGITESDINDITAAMHVKSKHIKTNKIASRTNVATETWREKVATAPSRYRTQYNWLNNNNAINQAISEPGVTIYGGSINPNKIDTDSQLRGSYLSRTQASEPSTLDTCLKRSVPDFRGGEAKSSLNTSFYQAVPFAGIGTGVGNMEVNNEMHFGETSRSYQSRKITDTAINRFEPLQQTEFQHPDSVVLPFPRGGIDTRNADRYSRQDQATHRI